MQILLFVLMLVITKAVVKSLDFVVTQFLMKLLGQQ